MNDLHHVCSASPRLGSRFAAWTLALCAALTVGQAHALQKLYGNVNSFTSSADRMISYRNQQHSWQTSDGGLHIMINLGTVSSGASLGVFSSFDGGNTWQQTMSFPNTDQYSTSDGALSTTNGVEQLQLAYATAETTGQIIFVTATYDSATQSWTQGAPQTVFAATGYVGSNPAFSVDGTGTVWCGFIAQQTTTTKYSIQMAYLPAQASTWSTTGLVFGAVDGNKQKSVRPVPYPGGAAMVYQDDENMYFAYRENAWTPGTPWTTALLFTNLPPPSQDPYDTHYSVIADANLNLYMAFIGAGQQLYFSSYSSGVGTWSAPVELLKKPVQAAYPEVTISDGNVVVLVNDLNSVVVFQSNDEGQTFYPVQALLHPPVTTGYDYNNPRIEVPKPATNPMPVWQQFVYGTAQELILFSVPAILSLNEQPRRDYVTR
jgi:hypothetical protein